MPLPAGPLALTARPSRAGPASGGFEASDWSLPPPPPNRLYLLTADKTVSRRPPSPRGPSGHAPSRIRAQWGCGSDRGPVGGETAHHDDVVVAFFAARFACISNSQLRQSRHGQDQQSKDQMEEDTQYAGCAVACGMHTVIHGVTRCSLTLSARRIFLAAALSAGFCTGGWDPDRGLPTGISEPIRPGGSGRPGGGGRPVAAAAGCFSALKVLFLPRGSSLF